MLSAVTDEPGVIASSSGKISTPWDVYQQFVKDFGTKDWIEKQKQYGREGLSEIIMFYAGPTAIFRPDVPRKHVTLSGIRSAFQFWPKLFSEVLHRRASCWCVMIGDAMCLSFVFTRITNTTLNRCLGCVQAILRGPSHTSFARDYTIDKCARKDRSECEFRSSITSETLPRRVAARWKSCANAGNRLASKVLPGAWVLFEVPHDPTEDLWLGRAVSNPMWEMKCVLVHSGPTRKVVLIFFV